MIPLIIDFSRKKVVIFGGGAVSARKARYFQDEAELTVISRSFSDAIKASPANLMQSDVGEMSDEEILSHLEGAFLVISALPDKNQNNRIGRLAAEAGILFNNADGEAGDVIIPSILRGRHLIAGFSTGGESPAVSRHLRDRFETIIPEIDAMVDLQIVLRDALKATNLKQEERAERLRDAIIDPEIREGLQKDMDATIHLALRRYSSETMPKINRGNSDE
ncbi:bifunctional precorrin-2 dehydrogenase/sirohydrochlorin ferrochelatase [Methanocalculus taiwanensis]|uniref:precorrin-2 dehydrogenase n=1 Tax=Methanocalculus taiwanensis TaxID=106207 RepID=A0ABD4TQI6_9EURY|nr:bifunctional precorrin-2 dehydrogenase/sirohydrochlorin ferrochelatase [Methanocalculus taiwanensis]MCQ1539565.1 bifunctional precorrin-2 dehydrogenase/sirohydrochlorin ferrochelatase [Methanocalculus taiwanensis]